MFRKGDYVVSDLDGLVYEVEKFGPRDEIEPLPGAKLVGNCAIVKSPHGDTHILYEWEMRLNTHPN